MVSPFILFTLSVLFRFLTIQSLTLSVSHHEDTHPLYKNNKNINNNNNNDNHYYIRITIALVNRINNINNIKLYAALQIDVTKYSTHIIICVLQAYFDPCFDIGIAICVYVCVWVILDASWVLPRRNYVIVLESVSVLYVYACTSITFRKE